MEHLFGTIHHADCIEFMQRLPDGCVNLIFADPPYNIGKATWDKIDDYYAWNQRWIQAASRVLAPNGAFWVSHSEPEQLILMSQLIAKYGRNKINWITWDKSRWAYVQKYKESGTRTFIDSNEYLIYHANEGHNPPFFLFESLRQYFNSELQNIGESISDVKEKMGFSGNMPFHWFARGIEKGRKSQFQIPTEKQYLKLQKIYHGHFLKSYSSIRREYESLCYTFRSNEKLFAVWQFPPASSSWHPTPKPEGLLRRIIYTTSNPDDVIYEPFAGTAAACRVAEKLGRRWFGTDTNETYVEHATKELDKVRGMVELFR